MIHARHCVHTFYVRDLRWVSCCPDWRAAPAPRPGNNRRSGHPARSGESRGAGDSGCRAWWADRWADSGSRRWTRCADAATDCNARNCGNSRARSERARGRTRTPPPCCYRPPRICCDLQIISRSVLFLTKGPKRSRDSTLNKV